MEEKVYNLFYFVSEGVVTHLGVVEHSVGGDDDHKAAYLKSRIEQDHRVATRIAIPSGLSDLPNDCMSLERFTALGRLNRLFELFLDSSGVERIDLSAFIFLTAIKDGQPFVDLTVGPGPLYLDKYENHPKIGLGQMEDYLSKYMSESGFDLSRLINDDYFIAIKILMNEGKYVSAQKLILSFIDTMSFLEYGDVADSFATWVRRYVDLKSSGLTAEELWELRNSLLHMTNLDSRKNVAGKVRRISAYISNSHSASFDDSGVFYFNLFVFFRSIVDGLERWLATFNSDRGKWVTFVERYDKVISDSRIAYWSGT